MQHSLGPHDIWILAVLGVTLAALGESQRSPGTTATAALLPEVALRCNTRSGEAFSTRRVSACQVSASTGQMLFQVSQQAQAILHDQAAYREFLDSEALLEQTSAMDPEALLVPSSAAEPVDSLPPPSFLELEEQMAQDTVASRPDAGEAAAASSAIDSIGATVSFASQAATAAAREVDEAYTEQVSAFHWVAKGLTSSAFIAVVAVFLAFAMLFNIRKSEWVLGRSKRGWWWLWCNTARSVSPSAPAEPEVFPAPKLASSSHESFSMLLVRVPVAGSEVSTVQISRSLDGPPLQSRMCCNPQAGSWSKIKIGPGPMVTSSEVELEEEVPFVVGKLVEIAADTESRNVQGALASWLSLLLDEKNEHVATDSMDATCVSPLASAAGHVDFADGRQPVLELYSGAGAPLGALWLATGESAECYNLCYNLVSQHGQPVVDIEANFDAGWMSMSKSGQVVALARFKKGRWSSPASGLSVSAQGDGAVIHSQELVQVDIVSGSTPEEIALLLACTCAVLLLEARSESAVNEDAVEG